MRLKSLKTVLTMLAFGVLVGTAAKSTAQETAEDCLNSTVQDECLVILNDHMRRIRLDEPAGTILVGDPSIVDVTVLGNDTMFVSARALGSTSITVLDKQGQETVTYTVFVLDPAEATARRAARPKVPYAETYAGMANRASGRLLNPPESAEFGPRPEDEEGAAEFDSCFAGDMQACWVMGFQYDTIGTYDENLPRAAAFYQKSCDGGLEYSCITAGSLYEHGGAGLPKDVARAMSIYRESCDRGNEKSCGKVRKLQE